jgi:hypothetical protein
VTWVLRGNGYLTKAASILTSIFVVEVCMKMVAFRYNLTYDSFLLTLLSKREPGPGYVNATTWSGKVDLVQLNSI